MNTLRSALLSGVAAILAVTGCASEASQTPDESDITSTEGQMLDFTFKGEVIAAKDAKAREAIVSQLQYTIGTLTTQVQGNANVGFVRLADVVETVEGNTKRIQYSATLPVVYPKNVRAPANYELALPLNTTALSAFNAKYDGKCGKNHYGQATFWHDFNPKAAECILDGETDVVQVSANVAPAAQGTQGKFPEYAEMLKDDALDLVAVYGIISSNTPSDSGHRTMDSVNINLSSQLTDVQLEEGTAGRGVVRSSKLTGNAQVQGRTIRVTLTSILTSEVNGAGPDFDALYGPVSANADFIVYNGHSGLGKNINALAAKTQVNPGKYQMLFLHGCQTIGYIGRALHDKKIEVNGAANDPNGSKFLDVIATGLPVYGDNGMSAMTFYRAILNQDRPKNFNQLLATFPVGDLGVVFGEEDNVFQPR